MSRVMIDGRWSYECDRLGCTASTETGEGRKGPSARIAERKGWKVTEPPRGSPFPAIAFCPAHKER